MSPFYAAICFMVAIISSASFSATAEENVMSKNTVISPSQFKAALQSVLENPAMNKRLYDRWDTTSKEYTSVWEDSVDGVYRQLADALGLRLKREHYGHIDAVFYKNFNKDFPTSVNFFSVVIEHENNTDTSWEEIEKLTVLNSPMKVVVTYPYEDYSVDELLSDYSEHISVSDKVWSNHSAEQRYIAVFAKNDPENEQDMRWEYHLYEKGKFVKMD